jgi:hypothetical protein
MSAVLTPAAPPAAASARPLKVTQGRVLHSEWTKFRSLRSTLYTLLAAVVLMIGIGALFSAVNANQYHTFSTAGKAAFSPISTSLTGTAFAVVAFGVLGVLLMSSEYSTGMIRASLTVIPRRLPVLWGKLAVFAGAIFSVSLVARLAPSASGAQVGLHEPPSSRTAIHSRRDPQARDPHRDGEPHVGAPAGAGRDGPARPPDRRLHGRADPARRRDRSRAAAGRPGGIS